MDHLARGSHSFSTNPNKSERNCDSMLLAPILFPSLKRRGGRDINKKLPFRSEAAGVVSSAEVLKMHSETFRLTDHPGCAISVASRLFISAHPLLFKEGNLPGRQISLTVLGLVQGLVPNLGGDVLQFVHLASAAP